MPDATQEFTLFDFKYLRARCLSVCVPLDLVKGGVRSRVDDYLFVVDGHVYTPHIIWLEESSKSF